MTASRINILHVEDNPNDAMLFRHACQKAGAAFELQCVNDGDEAIAYLSGAEEFGDRAKHPLPQMMLLDLKMQRLSGFDVLAWLRRESSFRDLPVIVLTSSSQGTDLQRAYDLGANSYLVKPVSFDALVDMAKSIQVYWLTLDRPGHAPGNTP